MTMHPAHHRFRAHRGYTLIELIVAVGLFALVMTLAAGAYLMMISINRQAQAQATGINNLSFALESMTRDIRTGTQYSCGSVSGQGDCSQGSSFTFQDESGDWITYSLSGGSIIRRDSTTGQTSPLTDPSASVSALTFTVVGTARGPANTDQARTTMVVSGSVSAGPGKTLPFTVETGATMRGTDL